jgi:hypothetical protein
MRDEAISVLLLEGQYHKCHGGMRDIYDIVLKSDKTDNLFIIYLRFYQCQNLLEY